MKAVKYLIGSLFVAFILAGCASSSGGANFDQGDILKNAVETEFSGDTNEGGMN